MVLTTPTATLSEFNSGLWTSSGGVQPSGGTQYWDSIKSRRALKAWVIRTFHDSNVSSFASVSSHQIQAFRPAFADGILDLLSGITGTRGLFI